MRSDLTAGDGPEATDGAGNTVDWGDGVDIYAVSAGTGDDEVTGDDGYNVLGGGSGADAIDSGGGNDYVYGGVGSDTIDSGDGNDRVYAFRTYRYGNDGSVDRVDCGSGADVVYIRKANAKRAVNCEEVYFAIGDEY